MTANVGFGPGPVQQAKLNQKWAHTSHERHTRNQHKADDNDPDRFELFILDEGQKKVETQEETRKFLPFPPHPKLTYLTHHRRPQHRRLHF